MLRPSASISSGPCGGPHDAARRATGRRQARAQVRAPLRRLVAEDERHATTGRAAAHGAPPPAEPPHHSGILASSLDCAALKSVMHAVHAAERFFTLTSMRQLAFWHCHCTFPRLTVSVHLSPHGLPQPPPFFVVQGVPAVA